MVLRVGWHREHFLSPLLQLHAAKNGFEVRVRRRSWVISFADFKLPT